MFREKSDAYCARYRRLVWWLTRRAGCGVCMRPRSRPSPCELGSRRTARLGAVLGPESASSKAPRLQCLLRAVSISYNSAVPSFPGSSNLKPMLDPRITADVKRKANAAFSTEPTAVTRQRCEAPPAHSGFMCETPLHVLRWGPPDMEPLAESEMELTSEQEAGITDHQAHVERELMHHWGDVATTQLWGESVKDASGRATAVPHVGRLMVPRSLLVAPRPRDRERLVEPMLSNFI